MEVKLTKLTIKNFKKLEEFVFEPNGDNAFVFGDNATGKTTIVDAFIWLLIGKNSAYETDFNIKPLDENNQPIHKLETVVSGNFMFDGVLLRLEKVYKEKYTKRRGEELEELTGHTTDYFADDVPLKKADYEAKVASFVQEKYLKLLTSPTFFTSQKWQDQRASLISIAGLPSEKDMLNASQFTDLINECASGKSVDDVAKTISASKKKLKDEIEQIPIRISEIKLTMPQLNSKAEIDEMLADARAELSEVDALIENINAANKKASDKQANAYNELNMLKQRALQLRNDIVSASKKQYAESQPDLESLRYDVSKIQKSIDQLVDEQGTILSRKEKIEKENADLRATWTEINAKEFVFDEQTCICPTCKQSVPESDVEEQKEKLLASFNQAKKKSLDDINRFGVENKERVAVMQTRLDQIKTEKANLLQKLEQAQSVLDKAESEMGPSWHEPDLTKEELELAERIKSFAIPEVKMADFAELKERKSNAQTQIDYAKQMQYQNQTRQEALARIDELSAQEKKLASELALKERIEFQIQNFQKWMITQVEEKVNSMFTLVKFKMYNQQMNGGLEPTCECMINGVPYSDLNTAGKVQAGLDIINTLSKHYDTYLPVFIDNRESVVQIPHMESQTISLFVKEGSPLTVSI